MTMIIHRANLDAGEHILMLPVGAIVLHAAWKGREGRPSLWYMFEAGQEEREKRKFLFAGTGHEIDLDAAAPCVHVSTFIAPDGYHVFHVFEVTP